MAAQNGSLPELFWMEQGGAVEMANEGYLADLTNEINSDQAFVDGFLPGMLDSLKIDVYKRQGGKQNLWGNRKPVS